jgi:ribonucleotide reductase beta subunit family protein with ferritin-like domain
MKTVLNKTPTNILQQPMFFGEDLGLQRYDIVKYPEFQKSYEDQRKNYWQPNEIPISNDRAQFENLSETERFVFVNNLAFQTMGDSCLSRTIESLKKYVSNSELEFAMNWWMLMENTHSESYTHILRNIVKKPSDFFDGIYENEEVMKRASQLTEQFDKLLSSVGDSPKEEVFKTVLSLQIAEGILFYVSFACTYWFGSRGLMKGNADIIKLINRDECVTGHTEIMTPYGWKPISELTIDDEIAQYTANKEIEFVKPSKIISHDVDEDIIELKNKRNHLYQEITKNHRVIYLDEKLNIREQTAEKFTPHSFNHIPVAGKLNTGVPEESITSVERFLIALQADGHVIKETANRNGAQTGCMPVIFTLKKERKQKRLEDILAELQWTYTKSNLDKKGRHIYYVKVPLDITTFKTFTWINIKEKSLRWCKEFLFELAEWDGHLPNKDHSRIYYSSVIKENVDKVQMIATACGWKTCHFIGYDNRKGTYNDIYRINILNTDYDVSNDRIQGGSIIKSEKRYAGKVYCPVVPSGMFIIRNNRAVSVTGNCLHVAITQNIMHRWKNDPSEGFKELIEQNEEIVYDAYRTAVLHEKSWANYLFSKGPLLGLSVNQLHNYIEWLANVRLRSMGFKQIFETKKNPMGSWIKEYINSDEIDVAPQEKPILDYEKGKISNDLESMDLNFEF